jgi:hypothetical protein
LKQEHSNEKQRLEKEKADLESEIENLLQALKLKDSEVTAFILNFKLYNPFRLNQMKRKLTD